MCWLAVLCSPICWSLSTDCGRWPFHVPTETIVHWRLGIIKNYSIFARLEKRLTDAERELWAWLENFIRAYCLKWKSSGKSWVRRFQSRNHNRKILAPSWAAPRFEFISWKNYYYFNLCARTRCDGWPGGLLQCVHCTFWIFQYDFRNYKNNDWITKIKT